MLFSSCMFSAVRPKNALPPQRQSISKHCVQNRKTIVLALFLETGAPVHTGARFYIFLLFEKIFNIMDFGVHFSIILVVFWPYFSILFLPHILHTFLSTLIRPTKADMEDWKWGFLSCVVYGKASALGWAGCGCRLSCRLSYPTVHFRPIGCCASLDVAV